MKFNLKQDWALLSKRARIFYIGFTVFNFILFILLLVKVDAGFFPPLIYFVFWQVAIWVYYMFRYKFRKKVSGGEWIDAAMFAIIAATLIRTFFIEAYQIPTSSMEKSLLRGDFLFVSKANYGARVPMTPISFPFVHQTLPVTNGKAYSEILKLPFYRLPGFQNIKNYDVVVFNYPGESEYPVDKKTNYIKRCIGIPGDDISIKDGKVYLNGKKARVGVHGQTSYNVQTSANTYLNLKSMDKLNISEIDKASAEGSYEMQLTQKNLADLKDIPGIVDVEPIMDPFRGKLFPVSDLFNWTVDNYGPIHVPKKGETILLNEKNYQMYKEVIKIYENNPEFNRTSDGKFRTAEGEITEYTFKMDYYFMMGDNRHHSADSRFWGFVPEDHVVGKALFIWMSIEPVNNNTLFTNSNKNTFQRIRWSRLFNRIH